MEDLNNIILNQFSLATGLNTDDYLRMSDSKKQQQLDFLKDVHAWIYERRDIGEKYIQFLKYMGLDPVDNLTVEVNKSYYDAIGRIYNTKFITPYNKKLDDNRIIASNLNYINNRFCLIDKDNNNIGLSRLGKLNKFITENPYDVKDLDVFSLLHNKNMYNIAFGIFGEFYDRDKKGKLELLKEFRNKIINDKYKFEYTTDKSMYMAALVSNYQNSKTKGY